jgi:hypothetical protein
MITALLVIIFGWIKYDLELIKADIRGCPRHGRLNYEKTADRVVGIRFH